MAADELHELCQDCLNKKTCNYIPAGGKLIRCLDRRTSQNPETEVKALEAGESQQATPPSRVAE